MTLNKYISFDISLHSTLSKFNKQSLLYRPSLNELLNILSNNWINVGYANLVECEKYEIMANSILTRYYSHPFDIGVENFIIDKFIKTSGPSGPSGKVISCKIDKMLELPNSFIEVIDYKSRANVPFSSSPFYDCKLYKNLYIINKELGFTPDYFSYYYLRYNKKLTLEINSKIMSILGTHYSL